MRQIHHDPCSPGRTLAALAASIAETQAAVLAHRLPDFESGMARQRLLYQELRHQKPAVVFRDAILRSDAARVLVKARLLAAVLRRVRQNLLAVQNALQGSALIYPPAAATMHRRN